MSDDESEFFDEDAQMCECGHISRDHAERAWNYACCVEGCKCRGFQGLAADDARSGTSAP
jgi:hypothetical protein